MYACTTHQQDVNHTRARGALQLAEAVSIMNRSHALVRPAGICVHRDARGMAKGMRSARFGSPGTRSFAESGDPGYRLL
jgi:hypothetical protein